MKNQQPAHILTQMGVLTSFSVAKKVTEMDVSNFFKKYRKAGKTDEQIGDILRDKIFEDIKDAIVNRKIPGLLAPLDILHPKTEENIAKNIIGLNRLIMVVAHNLVEKKYDKLSLCYFINSLVNILTLTEEDFEKFHRKMSSEDNDEE